MMLMMELIDAVREGPRMNGGLIDGRWSCHLMGGRIPGFVGDTEGV